MRFTYDLNGVIEVEATVVKTGKTVSHVVTKHAKGLSPKQIAEALENMRGLKFHPREESVNRFLLQRAERLYQELPAAERDRFDRLLNGFENALESGDANEIEEFRNGVREFMKYFDSGDDYEGPAGQGSADE